MQPQGAYPVKRMDRATEKKHPLLIPAMFDAHFPLLKYAFRTAQFSPVILDQGIEVLDTGLKYTNNDMCWPLAMMVGQMADALGSGLLPVFSKNFASSLSWLLVEMALINCFMMTDPFRRDRLL